MNLKSKILLSLVVMIVAIGLIFHELISYGLGQAKGQLNVLTSARPIEEFLNDPKFPDSLKSKIGIIKDVKQYAQSIGLEQSDNYAKMFDQKNKDILWNVSACAPYSLQNVTWSFPLLGEFGYKGFFDLEKAIGERDELKSQGFDTRIRPVSAWSTLGWFDDPILSNMLYKSEGQLAETILHELTHGTIFIKDQLEFNENLASFIGQEAARNYLEEKFGKASLPLMTYWQENEDAQNFRSHMLRATSKLDSLYSSFDDGVDTTSMQRQKDELIDLIIEQLDTVALHNELYYSVFDEVRPNNAYFMSFQRYHSAKDSLNSIYDGHDRDIEKFISSFKSDQR